MGEAPSATLAPLTRFPASAKVWHAITATVDLTGAS